MKLNTIAMFFLIFSLAIVGATVFYNDLASNYSAFGTIQNDSLADNYNKFSNVYTDINSTWAQVQGSESGDTSSSNFLVALSGMWSTVKLFFNSFTLVPEVIRNASLALKIPAMIGMAVMGIVLTLLVIKIISAAIRWKMGED